MYFNAVTIFNIIVILSTAVTLLAQTTCGDYECYEHTTCVMDQDSKMICLCKENYTESRYGNKIYCCLGKGDICGTNRWCNEELEYVSKTGEILKSEPADTESVEFLNSNCSSEQKCAETCCAENEICSSDQKCVAKATANCTDTQMCSQLNDFPKEKVYNNKEQQNDIDLVTINFGSDTNTKKCSENKLCGEHCCNDSEICSKDNKCVSKEFSNCPPSKLCHQQCCAANEICNERSECVNEKIFVDVSQLYDLPKEKVYNKTEQQNDLDAVIELFDFPDDTNTKKCSDNKLCGERCCNDSEICSNDNKCVSIGLSNCPPSKLCHQKCCAANEICNERSECVNEIVFVDVSQFYDFPKEKVSNKIEEQNDFSAVMGLFDFGDDTNKKKCSENQLCGEHCCNDSEICSNDNKCISEELNKCPPTKLCQQECCAANEICNERSECVNKKVFVDVLELYDLPKEKVSNKIEQQNDFSAVMGLFDFGDDTNTKKCSENQLCGEHCCNDSEICSKDNKCVSEELNNCPPTKLCHQKCCAANEICNERSECVFENEKSDKNATSSVTPRGYIIIGVGCMVAVISFSLFKIYVFKKGSNSRF